MKCQYDDGLTVDYSGALRVQKGSDVNVFIQQGSIPDNIKSQLDRCDSCEDMRKVAETVTQSFGQKACIHE